MLSSLPVVCSVTLTTRKQKATSVFLHPQSEEPEDKRSRTPLGFVLLFPSWKNVAVCRSNGCSPSTAFICRPAGGEEERCCVFSSRWKINFYSCATDCFSAAGEEEEEEGEEALEFINCRKDSVCEHPRKWTLQTEGGWWGWWGWWWRCVALCVWLNSSYTHCSHWPRCRCVMFQAHLFSKGNDFWWVYLVWVSAPRAAFSVGERVQCLMFLQLQNDFHIKICLFLWPNSSVLVPWFKWTALQNQSRCGLLFIFQLLDY